MHERLSGKTLKWVLWLGDFLALVLVTVTGFASHGELAQAGIRIFTTLIPLSVAWIIAAWPSGLFHLANAFEIRQFWRPAWAAVMAAPLAGLIRAWMLGNRPVIPVFILVLMATSMAAILIWRVLFFLIFRRKFSY